MNDTVVKKKFKSLISNFPTFNSLPWHIRRTNKEEVKQVGKKRKKTEQ